MKARSAALLLAGAAALAGFAPGCGGSGGTSQTHKVTIDVGGIVVWEGDFDTRVPGVQVVLTDIDGDTKEATTNSSGLWTINNVKPGAYIETYTKAGYSVLTNTFLLEAGGENDVSNIFVSRGTVALEEEPLAATVAPFGITLMPDDWKRDGFEGVSATFQRGGPITVTMNRRITNGTVRVYRVVGGNFVTATLDTGMTTFTVTSAQLNSITGGGLLYDTDPFTWARVDIFNVDSYSPIHGDNQDFDADLDFNGIP